jgi:hypothetical protein
MDSETLTRRKHEEMFWLTQGRQRDRVGARTARLQEADAARPFKFILVLYPRLPSCAKRLLPDYITTYEKDTTGLLKIGFPLPNDMF